ncbi:GDP-Man:Man(3)GlcNAc(2)-PP-Dol alpha-1:2-mannosyltransferase-like isoform X2 [Leptotrombidium deliense]|uniref:GDP-Man:Man(3)GlcNAc(2)-PP-Dol alpha-1,2-mannosyltransferase n=1 Tax=Leptotrombidium deliense TaxID=299467 RepID=A0A443SBJ8_9ACAR|nr:GDP-Man:Man(3)GlcNAc(2)-PP-Dol alpha-1:2-mannosyltransferase-like isoform X2 [Leptotrombidium deliense]
MFLLLVYVCPVFLFVYLSLRWKRFRNSTKSIAFFHPYCNAAGGGERVLWLAVSALQDNFKNYEIVIYCGDVNLNTERILQKVEDTFQIVVSNRIKFIHLRTRFLLEAARYPFFTLLFQSLASVVVAFEAIWKFCPDVYIDTTGFSFTHLVFKGLASCKVVCYVHYPTVSSDMLNSVTMCNVSFNNRKFITKSILLTKMKIFYYNVFAILYGFVGRLADVICVNSNWTKEHIITLWKSPSKTFLVFPPCDVNRFQKCAVKDKIDPIIISVAQFRPEKNHSLQLQAFKILSEKLNLLQSERCKLVIIGGCRNNDDEQRVILLKDECRQLGIESKVIFQVNASFNELLKIVESSKIGIHTMYNEHFGISIVELMAAGAIVVANNSGGPKCDIIENGVNGFLALTAEEYADCLFKVINMHETQLEQIRNAARATVKKFSDNEFITSFMDCVSPLINSGNHE